MVRVRPLVLVGLCACGRSGFEALEAADLAPDGSDGALGAIEVVLGQNSGDTAARVADTKIQFESPDLGYGLCDAITADGLDVTARILMSFDLGSLPAGARIDAAALELRIRPEPTADIATASSGLRVMRVLEAWEEGTVCDSGGAANWTERMSGVPWLALGAEPPSTDATVLGAVQGPLALDQIFTIGLPADLIQGWLDVPGTNHGVAIFADSEDGATVYGREGPDGTRPRLRLTLRP